MSIQEVWCKKLFHNGGLGYKYHKHMIGGALTEDSWNPIVHDGDESVYSLINDESTVTGFNPYPIGLDRKGRVMYEEYTPQQKAYFTSMRDIKRDLPREEYEINRYGEDKANYRKSLRELKSDEKKRS